MSEIKTKLQEVINETMLPEVNSYVEDLHKLIEDEKANDDDMEVLREMESFLVELDNILLAIKEDKMNDEQAQEVYDSIQQLIEDSKAH